MVQRAAGGELGAATQSALGRAEPAAERTKQWCFTLRRGFK